MPDSAPYSPFCPGPGAGPGPGAASPAPATAMAAVLGGLETLARTDWPGQPPATLAEVLVELERAEAVLVAARSGVLSAFTAGRGFEADGQGSARAWLAWQARITRPAAAAAVSWARRLAEHPALAGALADGRISASWARQLAAWSDLLPAAARADADAILAAAAAGGVDLAGLAQLAEQIRRHTAAPDTDGPDDGFADRGLRLGTTLGGAGRLTGDLTARCAAALTAVLDALGKKAGPEDTRTAAQRRHDALEEACRRLLAARCLPDRAGQPTQLQLHLTLDQFLTGLNHPDTTSPGTGPAGNWPGPAPVGPGPGVPAPGGPGGPAGDWLGTAPAGPGDDCDAALAPILTGRIDHDLLDTLAARLIPGTPLWAAYHPGADPCPRCGHTPAPAGSGTPGHPGHPGDPGDPGSGPGTSSPGTSGPGTSSPGTSSPGTSGPGTSSAGTGGPGTDGPGTGRPGEGKEAARRLLLDTALALLSGPGGLASLLRTGTLPRPAASISLPLDVGAATDLIPPHLRRAIITRDQHCAAPGCTQPPPACHIHHIVPRSHGGTTSLDNCLLLCSFHHLILIHRWGWTITLNPDGTTTATSPHGRTLHSHSPPPATAA